MELEQQLKQALEELRKEKTRKFNQTVDLIVNFQKYSHKKNPINLFVSVPHKAKDKKVAGFFQSKSEFVDTITLDEFKKYTDKKSLLTIADHIFKMHNVSDHEIQFTAVIIRLKE